MKKVYLIAVVFALLAGFATYMFASQINSKTTIKDADTVAVVMALQDIPKNTIITESMINADPAYFNLKQDVIAADATPVPISDVNSIVGMITSVDIYAGEQLNEHKFVSADSENVGLSYKLSPGKVAFSFTASSTNGVDGYISPGDSVDIITYEVEDGKATTKVAYKDLRIIRVSSASAQAPDSKITSYSTLTVEVTEKQAQQLYQIEKEKTYKLVLNSRRDETTEENAETVETEQESQTESQQDSQN